MQGKLFRKWFIDNNLVIIDVKNELVEDPITVSKLMYHNELKKYENKKYLILNRWDNLDEDYYKTKLSTILKARAAENFCVVTLLSNIKNECIQVGLNKNVQIIKCDNNKYELDLKRATGPESFWKNNNVVGVKAKWRSSYENLINTL